MEFLVKISAAIVGKIAEFTVGPVILQVGYVIHFNKNLKKLKRQVKDLDAARESMQRDVKTEERKGKEIDTAVRNWLIGADEITEEANDFLKDERHAETKCLHGFCPNVKFRHQLSRKSTKLVKQMAEISEKKKELDKIAYDVKPEDLHRIPAEDYQAFDSRTSVAKKIMNELREPSTYMIGAYGIGGVGKTTLAKEVYRQAKEETLLFDDVVMLLDVKGIAADLKEIQKRIAEKLGMDILGDESIDKRAGRLCSRIKDKKVLVILDDLQEKVDLEIVGLPRVSNCKVLLTSRTREVLSVEMRTQKEFQLDLLDENENWSLFEKMAGDVVKDPTIRDEATQVAQKCGGLPLLVVTVASALKNSSTPQAWRNAKRRLKKFEEKGFMEKAFLALEWSYEQLDDEELKPLFLLCGSVKDSSIYLPDLFNYSMGLGLLKNVDTMEEAQDSLHSLLEKLKDSCLLLDDNSKYVNNSKYVSMHDLVHEVAIRIASRDHHVFKVATGDEFKEWPTKDFCIKSTMIILNSCTITHLPESLEFPELKMFRFSSRYLDLHLEIPSNFFKGMKKLRVLDLNLLSIPSLPPALPVLKSLQALHLDSCTLGDLALVGELKNLEILSLLDSIFTKLPKEIGQLTRLRLLDLNGCSQLQVISPNVISKLKRLEVLRMGNSFNQWEGDGVVSSERRNANIEELKHLTLLTALQIHIVDANILPAYLFTTSKLERFQICIGSAWNWYTVDNSLNALKLQLTASNELDQGLGILLTRTENLYLEGTEGVNNSIVHHLGAEGFQKLKHLHVQTNVEFMNIINPKVTYPNLTWLDVSELNGLRFLLSSSMARSLPQLKRLQISGCQKMEEIVLIEIDSCEEMIEIVGSNANDDSENDIGFRELKHLELSALPSLRGFCSGTRKRIVKFPSLKKLSIMNCSQLEAFIFDPNCTIGKDINDTNSIENIETGVVHQFLFDKKVEFPRLWSLFIVGLTKLTAIWHSQLSLHSFSRLKDLRVHGCGNLISIFPSNTIGRLNALTILIIKECKSLRVVFELGGIDVQEIHATSAELENLLLVMIHSCENLKNIFPTSVARNLRQLTILEVLNSGVEEIIRRDEELQTPPKFVFPKVTIVRFSNLSQLKNFYPGMHVSSWPSLLELDVGKCLRVNILAKDISSFQGDDESEHLDSRALFLIEKDAFPNLERLILAGMEIWNVLLQVQLFSKLEDLDMTSLQSMSVDFLEGNNSSINAVGIVTEQQQQWHLPHLKKLRLVRNEKLMHLGKEDEDNNTQSAPRIPNIPNLEILVVNGYHSLRNLRSSAISFNNLTTLQVTFCNGLKYLITYSMANSLMQLTTLEIVDCLRLVEIVGSDDEGDDDSRHEITFRRLKHLTLLCLPSLQRFCSGNCIPKFPFLEMSTMSKRLKLKICIAHDQALMLTNEEEDTDVDYAEARIKRESASTN